MTRKTLLAVAACFLCLATVAAPADARGRRSLGGSKYSSNGKFGLGLELGVPNGLNGKLFLSPSTALNFGVGWLYDRYYRDGDGIHLYLDHLWHPVQLTENATFKLPFYVGVGGRFWSVNRYNSSYDYSAVGVRVPVGLAFDFNNVPLDIFLQLTFGVDLFFGDYNRNDRRYGPQFGGSIGIRYWFD